MNDSKAGNNVSYCSHNSVLVVNSRGRLRRVFVPFKVFGKNLVNGKRCMHIVEEVTTSKQDVLIYVIAGKACYYYDFVIDICF